MPPLIWILTNGRRGDIVQCEAIAAELSNRIVTKTLCPRKFYEWWMPWGPCDPKDLQILTPPYPDLIVASGRRSVPYVRHIVAESKGHTKAAFMKYTGTDVSAYAFSWHPRHDERPGKAVVETLLSPHPYSLRYLQKRKQTPNLDIASLPAPRLGVMVGGNTKTVTYREETIATFCQHLEEANHFASLIITTSRRTPAKFLERLKKVRPDQTFLWWPGSSRPNPYVDMLATCDAFLVTGDSHNLVSEALAAGKKVYAFNPPGNSRKLQFTLKELDNLHKIKLLPTSLESGEQTAFNETSYIAQSIRDYFFPQPSQ